VASEAISAGVTDYLQKETGLEQFTLLANRLENAVEQARTTRELRQEKHRRDRILEATPMGVVVHDATGAVTLVNERARELLGATDAEMDAGAYQDAGWRLLTSDGDPIDYEGLPFSRVMASDAPIHDVEYVVERADGTRQPIAVHGAPLRDDSGTCSGAVIVFGPQ
jgi:PAS domain S-box-containing protein